ncbi:hypothetical protein S83_051566, partial [Arachis hypogaea]
SNEDYWQRQDAVQVMAQVEDLQGDQHHSSNTSNVASSDANQTLDENGKFIFCLEFCCYLFLLRSHLRLGAHNNVTSSAKTIVGSTPLKQNQRHKGSARKCAKGSNETPENRIAMHDSRNSSKRLEKRVRHKDRPNRGVWTNRSIGGDDSLSASSQVDHLE